MKQIGVVVIGAGFAGLSTAYHLAKAGCKDVVVLERDRPGSHASGNNAGMIRQALSDPFLAKLAKEGRAELAAAGKKWGVAIRPTGSLLLARRKDHPELADIRKALSSEKIPYRILSKRQVLERVPFIEERSFESALFCPSDAALDVKALLRSFRNELRRMKVPVLSGRRIRAIRRIQEGFHVETSQGAFSAGKVINAAGAWAEIVGRKAGAAAMPFTAYRRHLFVSPAFGQDKKSWPFVWHLDGGFYFRPETASPRALMLSPCDKVPMALTESNSSAESPDPAMRRELLRKLGRFSRLSGIRIRSTKVGLRTMTPDGRFVIGEDPKLKGFFWVAGLGGHGVTTSFSVGRLAADIILGRPRDEKIAKAVSPRRFRHETS